jgi:hypothetical protein
MCHVVMSSGCVQRVLNGRSLKSPSGTEAGEVAIYSPSSAAGQADEQFVDP